jgi:hypothetical protein
LVCQWGKTAGPAGGTELPVLEDRCRRIFLHNNVAKSIRPLSRQLCSMETASKAMQSFAAGMLSAIRKSKALITWY